MDPYIIPSVVHSCQILRLLATNDQGLTTQSLFEELALPRTTLFRLLRTLCEQQMVEKKGKLYFCGAGLLQIGFDIINSGRLHQLAIPHIQKLVLKSGHTAHLAIPHNGFALIVEVFDSPNSLFVSKRPGVQSLMHCTSTGKVFLTFLYDDNLDLMFTERPMEKLTEHTITDVNVLRKELKKVEALGYAIDDREYNKDVRCLAVPVRDNNGIVVAAVGITAPAVAFPKSHINSISELTKEAARGIYKDVYQVRKVY